MSIVAIGALYVDTILTYARSLPSSNGTTTMHEARYLLDTYTHIYIFAVLHIVQKKMKSYVPRRFRNGGVGTVPTPSRYCTN